MGREKRDRVGLAVGEITAVEIFSLSRSRARTEQGHAVLDPFFQNLSPETRPHLSSWFSDLLILGIREGEV